MAAPTVASISPASGSIYDEDTDTLNFVWKTTAAASSPVAGDPTVKFAYTGKTQSFKLPTTCSKITVDLKGAGGGDSDGGKGGHVGGTKSVTGGSVIYINVGGRGGNAATPYGGDGGWNGGGSGGHTLIPPAGHDLAGGGGGGATDIRIGGNALSNRVAVAAGGGGGGRPTGPPAGGDGGASTGDAGTTVSGAHNGGGGGGGTQTAGGAKGHPGFDEGEPVGISDSATPGSLGVGGHGNSAFVSHDRHVGGGGGGGYYGGGGGGGSSYQPGVANWSSGGGGGGSNYTGGLTTATANERAKGSAAQVSGSATLIYNNPAQHSYQLVIENNSTGASLYNSTEIIDDDQSLVVDISSLPIEVDLRWRVRVSEMVGGVATYSTWTSYRIFRRGTNPLFAITNPSTDEIVDTSEPDITWATPTFYGGRTWRNGTILTIRDMSGPGSVVYTETLNAGITSHTLKTPALASDHLYQLSIVIFDSAGVSATQTVSFSTHFFLPASVEFTIDTTMVDDGGYVLIDWSNTPPDPDFVSWNIYRKFTTDLDWTPLVTITDVDENTYKDFLVISDRAYQYCVTQTASRGGVLVESPIGYQAVYGGSRRNLMRNPSTEVSTDYWEAVIVGSETPSLTQAVSPYTSTAWDRDNAIQLSYSSGSGPTSLGAGLQQSTDNDSLVPGTGYQFSAAVTGPTGLQITPRISWRDSSNFELSVSDGSVVTFNQTQWTEISFTAEAPTNADHAVLQFLNLTSTILPDTGAAMLVDGVLFEPYESEGVPPGEPYFDGSQDGATWDGVDDLSSSTMGASTLPVNEITGPFTLTHYVLIDIDNPDLTMILHSVTDAPIVENFEEATYTLIARGRKKDYGTRFGYSGTLTMQWRGYDGEPALYRTQLDLLKRLQDTMYLRTPLGDLFLVAIGDISYTPLAGVGPVAMYDVTVPFEEVS